MATTDTTTDTESEHVAEAEALADEMAETKARTTDSTVEGTVTRIRELSPSFDTYYKVTVETPHGEVTHRFDKPSAWTHDYAFVRWVEGLGYTAENFHHLIKDDVRVAVAVDADDDELVVPRKSVRTLAHNAIAVATRDLMALGFVVMLGSVPLLFALALLDTVVPIPGALAMLLTIGTAILGAAIAIYGACTEGL